MNYALDLTKLTKKYGTNNNYLALNEVDLKVQQGDFFALLGPNGAGKSTLIGIVSHLVNKTSGQIKVFGYDLDTQLEDAKLCLGVVPQEFNFNQFEPLEQILVNQAGFYGIPYNEAKLRAKYYLTKLNLWDKRNVKARELSGGMKRRLMVARALMHEPKLLILDEPTAGVDVELRYFMWNFLTELNKSGVTIILTTHYLEEAETLCRNIGIIDRGHLIKLTSMRALLQQLEMETFVLNVTPCNNVNPIDGIDMRFIDNETIEIDILKTHSLNDIFAKLTSLGINVLSMRNQTNRLEKLFLDIVAQKESK